MNDECELCGRSMMGRFQEAAESAECESCTREFDLLSRAGKLRIEGWTLVVVQAEDLGIEPSQL